MAPIMAYENKIMSNGGNVYVLWRQKMMNVKTMNAACNEETNDWSNDYSVASGGNEIIIII